MFLNGEPMQFRLRKGVLALGVPLLWVAEIMHKGKALPQDEGTNTSDTHSILYGVTC